MTRFHHDQFAAILAAAHTSPAQAIRDYYLDQCHGVAAEVAECISTSNPLHPYRFGTKPPPTGAVVEPPTQPRLAAIRDRCLDCSGGSSKSVKTCLFKPGHVTACQLWAYRFGTNPSRTGIGGRNLPTHFDVERKD